MDCLNDIGESSSTSICVFLFVVEFFAVIYILVIKQSIQHPLFCLARLHCPLVSSISAYSVGPYLQQVHVCSRSIFAVGPCLHSCRKFQLFLYVLCSKPSTDLKYLFIIRFIYFDNCHLLCCHCECCLLSSVFIWSSIESRMRVDQNREKYVWFP